MVDVVEARYVRDYTVWLKFEDGAEGEVDLSAELHGPVFEPLRDPTYFRHFIVSPDLGTISWPNGADFAPEFLYDKLHVPA
jgi:hypothetical protein